MGPDVATLVADLKSGNMESRERTAKHLAAAVAASADPSAEDSLSPASRAVRAGAIQPLVALVGSGSDGAQMHASSALASIAAAGHRADVAAANSAIASLVTVLRQSSQQAAAQAAAVLASVAELPTSKVSILKSGALPALVRQLKVGLTEARISAALAIAHLCARSGEAQQMVLATEAVPVLIGLLASGKAQTAAAHALAQLCEGSADAQASVSAAGGIPPLLSLLNGVNVQCQVHAAAALAAVAHGNPATQALIARAGGIGPLLALLPTKLGAADAACALGRLARGNADNQEAIVRNGGLLPLLSLLSAQNEREVQAMAAMAVADICRGSTESQRFVAEYGGIAALVVLLRTTERHTWDSRGSSSSNGHGGHGGHSHGDEEFSACSHSAEGSSSGDGASSSSSSSSSSWGLPRGSVESIKMEAAGALWVLAEEEANRTSIASAGALGLLVSLLAEGGAEAHGRAANALSAIVFEESDNLSQLAALLVKLLGNGAAEAQQRGVSLLWRLVGENPQLEATVAKAGSASDLISLLKLGSPEVEAYALWSLSLSIDAANQSTVLEEGGAGRLVHLLQHAKALHRTQAAAALARLASGNTAAQTAISQCGGIAPLIAIVDPSSHESMPARVFAASALAELSQIPASRDAIVDARGVPCIVALLTVDGEGEDTGERYAASALSHIAGGKPGTSMPIADAGAISPLVKLLTGQKGELAQQEAAGALYALADETANRIAITDAGGIGPLVLLLGSTNARAREHAEGALVRLSLEIANRELIIKKLVSMLYDKGSGGEEQAAAALANLASDSADNRNSIVDAGGIPPLLSLLEMASPKAKENAISAISQLAHHKQIRSAIAKAGGIPMLANALAATSSSGGGGGAGGAGGAGKDATNSASAANALSSLSAFAIAQLSRGHRSNQLALAEAGAIPPLVAMLGSPSSEMQANAANALAALSRHNADNQHAVARTGAIAPLCSLVREGAPNVKEQSAAAIWSLAADNAPNKATVAKLGGIEPLIGLLVGADTPASLEHSVGALGALASKHADNCEAIARMIVGKLSSRMAMSSGNGAVRVLLAVAQLCKGCAQNQLAIAKAGGIPPLINWLSGCLDSRSAFSADAQREAAHALLEVCACNAPLQAVRRRAATAPHSPCQPSRDRRVTPPVLCACCLLLPGICLNSQVVAKSEEGIPALIGLVRKGDERAKGYAARTLWHLAGNSESVASIVALGGIGPLVAMLTLEETHAQELAAVVVARLTRSHPDTIASSGGIAPLVNLIRFGTPVAALHACSALADMAKLPAHRDAISFDANAIKPLVRLLESKVVGTPETAARALAHLARDLVECPDDGGAASSGGEAGDDEEEVSASTAEVTGSSASPAGNDDDDDNGCHASGGEARRQMILSMGGVSRLIGMLWAVPDSGMGRRMWALVASVIGESGATALDAPNSSSPRGGVGNDDDEDGEGSDEDDEVELDPKSPHRATLQRSGSSGTLGLERAPSAKDLLLASPKAAPPSGGKGSSSPASARAADDETGKGDAPEFQAAEQAAAALADLSYGDESMQDAILGSGGVAPLLKLIRGGSVRAQEHAARCVWHLCACVDNHGALVDAGAVGDLVALSKTGSAKAQELAAAVISDLAKGAIVEREKALQGRSVNASSSSQPAALSSQPPIMRATSAPVAVQAGSAPPLPPAPADVLTAEVGHDAEVAAALSAGEAPRSPSDAGTADADSGEGPVSGDRLAAIAAAGGIGPLVGLVSAGSQTGKTRAASALWHLANGDASNQVSIAKAGGIAPLVQMLDDGSARGVRYAADALHHLATDNADNQAQIAKKLVGLLDPERYRDDAQRRAAHALWRLAKANVGAPVRVVNAGAISPLVSLLHDGSLEAKTEAAGALSCLAYGDVACQLAIATGLVAQVGTGSAEAQEHVTRMLIQLAATDATNRKAIVDAGAVERLIGQLKGGGSTSLKARELAASVLWHLARGSASNVGLIVSHGGIAPLVALLGADSEGAQVRASSALQAMASLSADAQAAIVTEGGIEPLVGLLSAEAGASARSEAAGALWSLANGSLEHTSAIVATGAIDALVALLREGPDAKAQRQAARALGCLAAGGGDIKSAIANAGGVEPLVALLHGEEAEEEAEVEGADTAGVHAAAAAALAELIRDHPVNQTAANSAIAPLAAVLRTSTSAKTKDEAAAALWAFATDHHANQAAIKEAGGIGPLVELVSVGGERAQAEAAGALAALALGHEANRSDIATRLVRLLAAPSDDKTRTQLARGLARFAKADGANQSAIAAVGGIAPLVNMLVVPASVEPTPRMLIISTVASSRAASRPASRPASLPASQPVSQPVSRPSSPEGCRPEPAAAVLAAAARLAAPSMSPQLSRPTSPGGGASLRLAAVGGAGGGAAATQAALIRELAGALWSLAEAHPDNQEAIAAAGGVPLLIALLQSRSRRSVHRDAAGVLWSLADSAANQRRIAELGGVPPLVALLAEGDAGAQHTAAGALRSLAKLPENRDTIAAAGGVPALAKLLEGGSERAKSEASGALASLVVGNLDNQLAVANELVARLSEAHKAAASLAPPIGIKAHASLAAKEASGRAQEAVTKLLRELSLDPENRNTLSKAGAIPELATQLRDGTPDAMVAAASALTLLSLKAPQYRVQVTAQLIKLLGSEDEHVRQRAGSALKDLSTDKGSDSQMTIAMAGGIERFVVLLTDGSLEAKEYALWLLCQSSDHASRVSIATADCATPIVQAFLSGQLSAVAEEHAAAVLAGLSGSVAGVADAVRAANHVAILSSGGIAPLVRLLRSGSEGAKRHAATALTHLSCDLAHAEEEEEEEEEGSKEKKGEEAEAKEEEDPNATERRRAAAVGGTRSASSKLMQTAMAREGAITAFVEWLFEPSLGRSALAAQALAHISRGSPDAQATIAEEGALEPLVDMLDLTRSLECQKWGAFALAALADGHASNRAAIAEEGGIERLVALVARSEKAAPHEAATQALWHLAADEDNQLAIARLGGLAPLVRLLAEGSEQCQEWAAAALEALARDCESNQAALYRAGAVAPLVALLGCGEDETAAYAQGALLSIATPGADTRGAVVRPLVQLLEQRNASAQRNAAETLSLLSSRSAANRSTIAVAGAIPPLVRLLGDGRDASTSQVFAASALADLARASDNKAAMVSVGGVPPLVRMLGSRSADARCFASVALHHLAATSSAQALIAEHNGISLLVELVCDTEPLATANASAGALWHLAATTGNKAAIVKAGGIPRLISLLERTDTAEARESAAAVLAELARSGSQKAIVAGGGIAPLVSVLAASRAAATPGAHKHAACALWGLTSDSATHQAAVTSAGAVAPLVDLLSGNPEAQGYAAAALCNLARDGDARRAIVDAGGLEPLADLAKTPDSAWLRAQASGILELISEGFPASSKGTNAGASSVMADALPLPPPAPAPSTPSTTAAAGLKSAATRVHLALVATRATSGPAIASENNAPANTATAKAEVAAANLPVEAEMERPTPAKSKRGKRPPRASPMVEPRPSSLQGIVAEAVASHAKAQAAAPSRAESPRPASAAPSRLSTQRSAGSRTTSRAASREASPRLAASGASTPRATGAASAPASRVVSRAGSRAGSRTGSPRPADKKKEATGLSPAKASLKAAAHAVTAFHTDGHPKKGKRSSSTPRPVRAGSPLHLEHGQTVRA